jgi:hypothetical protein
MSKIKAQKKQ